MSVMDNNVFDGTKPVACLRFLTAYKRALDDEGIPEGAGLRIWPNFLKYSAYDAFTQMLEDGNADLGGFSTWQAAVQFFIQTYAKDEYLEDDVIKLDGTKQGRDEDVLTLHGRLLAAARDLAGAYSQDELMTKFMQGVYANIRPLLRRARKMHKSPNRFRIFAEEASAIYAAHNALAKTEKKLSVEEDPPKRRYYPSISMAAKAKGDSIALAELQTGRESVSTFTEPVESSCPQSMTLNNRLHSLFKKVRQTHMPKYMW